VTFISSSDQSAVGANTAAWVSMLPTCATSGGGPCADNVNSPSVAAAVDAAGSGQCPVSTLQNGTSEVQSTNGMVASVYNNHLIPKFIEKYNASGTLEVKKAARHRFLPGQGLGSLRAGHPDTRRMRPAARSTVTCRSWASRAS
jgi:hypothetical protein